MSKRVFELAKDLEMSSKELLQELERLGFNLPNHMAVLDDRMVDLITDRIHRKREEERKARDPFAGLKSARRILIKKKKVEPAPSPATTATAPKPQPPESPGVEPPVREQPAPPIPSVAPAAGPQASPTPPAPSPPRVPPEKEMTKPAAPPATPPPVAATPPATGPQPVTTPPSEAAPTTPGVETRKTTEVKWKDFKPVPRKDRRVRAAAPAAKRPKPTTPPAEVTKPRKKVIKLSEGMTVKEFAETIGQKVNEVIARLMEMGIMATINQPIDMDAAMLIADHYGIRAEVVAPQEVEDLLQESPDPPEALRPRPPVVTVMGHVDHGKTSLLDAIRKTKVTEQEAGGITQHIGAYMVTLHDRSIVFLDTPGHEAFTAMRARGAKVTDVVVLVVAADDGVRPQTLEAIDHARAAGVSILVAINKIDKPEANPDRVRQQLAQKGLIPEEWGGDTIFVEVSAKKRIGLDHLLEMILLQADVLELKANPDKPARGTILEARLDRGRGPVGTVLVQAGTLRVGEPFVCGIHYGRVRALINDEGKSIKEAGPSVPVEVTGFSGVPQAGDSFVVVEDEKLARSIAQTRQQKQRIAEMERARKVSLEDFYSQVQAGKIQELNLIIKADVQGSAEALVEALSRLSTEKVKVRIHHASAGGITETDINLAAASNAIVISFNVRPDSKALALAEREQVDVRTYSVIYDAVEDVRKAMEGLLEPTYRERVLGRAEVRQLFHVPRVGVVCGCYVLEGTISRSCAWVRVLRDQVVVHEGRIASLKRFKEDVREVQAGYECGLALEGFQDVKVGDIIEAYDLEKVTPSLE